MMQPCGMLQTLFRESLWRAPERLRQPKGQMRIVHNRRGAFQILRASQGTFLQADTFLSREFPLLHRDPPSPPESSMDFLSVRRSDSSRTIFKTAIVAEESLLDSLSGSECNRLFR